jgi:hypothetical protein
VISSNYVVLRTIHLILSFKSAIEVSSISSKTFGYLLTSIPDILIPSKRYILSIVWSLKDRLTKNEGGFFKLEIQIKKHRQKAGLQIVDKSFASDCDINHNIPLIVNTHIS